MLLAECAQSCFSFWDQLSGITFKPLRADYFCFLNFSRPQWFSLHGCKQWQHLKSSPQTILLRHQMDSDWEFIPASPKCSVFQARPLPVPQPTRPFRPRHDGQELTVGGLPIPAPRSRAKSAALPPPKPLANDPVQGPQQFCMSVSPQSIRLGRPGRDRPMKSTATGVAQSAQLLRLQKPSNSGWLVQEWNSILSNLGKESSVHQALESSSHPQEHAARILDQFAPSTLLRYFSAWQSFYSTLTSLHLSIHTLTESALADALVSISLSKKMECSAGCQITIKAIRWVATHAGVSNLSSAWSPLVESFLRSRIPKELKESVPLSLFTLIQLERRILMSSCPVVEVVIIGAILVCTWAGLRFADAQRCSFQSFCYDGKSLRGSCWRTKTSHRGQPWGITASGFLSLGTFCWTEKWLITMDELWHTSKSTDLDMQVPDFLFPQLGQEGIALPWTPMSYADALFWIRKITALPWKQQPQESSHWTAHSMKSTLLSWGAQLIASGTISQEERLLQGHHRQGANRSLRVYSRDDVYGQLTFQSKLVEHVRRGGRFAVPQHRGAQHPLAEPSVQVEFFRKSASQYTWKCFEFSKALQPVVEQVSAPTLHEDSSSSSGDSSDSSESSASESMANVPASRQKRIRKTTTPEPCEEILIAAATNVQHAMVASSQDWHPYFSGSHYQAACGARLDPDKTRFYRDMDAGLLLCQCAACMKAWKAVLD